MSLKRWLYKGGRPNWLASLMNAGWAVIHAWGIAPNYLVTLEVVGRKSGKTVRFPLVLTMLTGQRYLVSMLGNDVSWIRNVKAASGRAQMVHGRREQVMLEDVPVNQRAAIIKAYLQIAPGARGHIPVHQDASIDEFERVAAQVPVFRVVSIA
jgi:hypothetical protein